MVKTVKFGGSSLASAMQFQKVKDIIQADPSRRYVIPSAPGKRDPDDTKVTDLFYACYKKIIWCTGNLPPETCSDIFCSILGSTP